MRRKYMLILQKHQRVKMLASLANGVTCRPVINCDVHTKKQVEIAKTVDALDYALTPVPQAWLRREMGTT